MLTAFPGFVLNIYTLFSFLEQRPGQVWLIWMRLRWSWVSAVQLKSACPFLIIDFLISFAYLSHLSIQKTKQILTLERDNPSKCKAQILKVIQTFFIHKLPVVNSFSGKLRWMSAATPWLSLMS